MKLISYIKWQYKKIDTWSKFWFLAFALIGAALAEKDETISHYFFYAAVTIFAGMLMHGLYKIVQANYKKFEKECDELFVIIKNSDKK